MLVDFGEDKPSEGLVTRYIKGNSYDIEWRGADGGPSIEPETLIGSEYAKWPTFGTTCKGKPAEWEVVRP